MPRSLSPRAHWIAANAIPVMALAIMTVGGALQKRAHAVWVREVRQQYSEHRRQERLAVTPGIALATFDTVWTRVRDLHYDTLMNGVNWTEVRESLRPRAANASSIVQLRAVLSDMLSRLGQSHYTIIPREASGAFASTASDTGGAAPGDAGLEMRAMGNTGEVIITRSETGSPAYQAGVRAGWRVELVDDVSARAVYHADEYGTAAAARAERLTRQKQVMRLQNATTGPAGSQFTLVVSDPGGKRHTLRLTRTATSGEVVKYGNLPVTVVRVSSSRIATGAGCTAVIAFNRWMPAAAPRIDAAVDSLRSCGGLVLDLRGNTGGVMTMVVGIAGHFIATPDTLVRMKTRTSQLQLVTNPRLSNVRGERVAPFAGPVAILVDELTGSTSEIFTLAMQSHGRARVFGDTTAGQALPATTQTLPSGDVLLLAVADLRGPRGERIEGTGVVPDVIVPRSRADLLASRDAAMDAALLWLAGQSKRLPGGSYR